MTPSDRLDATFAALADPTRRAILARLTSGEASVAELATSIGEQIGPGDALPIEQERVNLFADATGDHQWIHVDAERAAAGPFAEADDWLENYRRIWEASFRRLDALLNELKTKEKKPVRTKL